VTLRAAFFCVALVLVLMLIFEGESIRRDGEQMDAGWQRTMVLAVGQPAGWISLKSGMHGVKNNLVEWARSGDDLAGAPGGFGSPAAGAASGATGEAAATRPVDPHEIDSRYIDRGRSSLAPLSSLLVTGDSMSQPLDSILARDFSDADSKVIVRRDARIGTGISKSELLDWGKLSNQQVAKARPNAVVMFLGANEGFPMQSGGRSVECCGVAWATEYASRARQMMNTYRRAGAARVYWLNLPAPRSVGQQRVSRTVNAAILAAAAPFRDEVRVIDLSAIFTPGGVYRSNMETNGHSTLVREADGVHLNEAGAKLAAEELLDELRADFGNSVPR
jgi:hypothetical protein